MILVTPVKETEEIKQVFACYDIEYNDGCFAMKALEDDAPVGFGLFSLVERDLTLLFVDYPADDPAVCDLVTRAVMNYGINRGALECALAPTAPKEALIKLGFLPNESADSMNIVHVFTHCTHCRGEQKEI